jgi:hypothetical protein
MSEAKASGVILLRFSQRSSFMRAFLHETLSPCKWTIHLNATARLISLNKALKGYGKRSKKSGLHWF